REDAYGAPFHGGRRGLARPQVDRWQGLHERRDRLERDARDHVLAVRDPSFEPAGAVARTAKAGAAALDRVMHPAAALAARVERLGEFDALRRGDGRE